jgi:hypothetical protein
MKMRHFVKQEEDEDDTVPSVTDKYLGNIGAAIRYIYRSRMPGADAKKDLHAAIVLLRHELDLLDEQ